MLEVVAAAVVVLAVLCVVNLMVTLAALRRLREYGQGPVSAGSHSAEYVAGPETLLGNTVPEFQATAVTGEVLTRASFVGRLRLLGFFSASCAPCHEQARAFAGHHDPARVAVVQTFGAKQADANEMLGLLAAVPALVVEGRPHGLADTLGVSSFPSILRTDGSGVITHAGSSMQAVAVPAR
jgi:hypothetical protein